METKKVHTIESVSLSLIKTNPPSVLITVKAENLNSNYTNIRLEPFIYIHPPLNGVWEFTMVGDVPPITDNLITRVGATLEWHAPKDAKGVKVYGETNSKTALLFGNGGTHSTTTSGIHVIKAEAVIDAEPMKPPITLNVNLTYNSNNHGFHNLKMASPQGINPKVLLLVLTDEPEDIFITNPRHAAYSKELTETNQYSSIQILHEGNSIATINHIPILV